MASETMAILQSLKYDQNATDWYESYYEFADFVKTRPSTSSCEALPAFAKLPPEMVLNIVRQCDAPTLFSLMRTSRVFRQEAKKHFWAKDVWYSTPIEWLACGGYPGSTLHDLDALLNVKQLEIIITPSEDRSWVSNHNDPFDLHLDELLNAKAPDFWASVKRLFPSVQRIVFASRCHPGLVSRTPAGAVAEDITEIFRACPEGIELYISRLRGQLIPSSSLIFDYPQWLASSPLQQIRWRWNSAYPPASYVNPWMAGYEPDLPSPWTKTDHSWRPIRVIPPMKPLEGPIGYFARQQNAQRQAIARLRGDQLTIKQALHRSIAVFGGIPCPITDCHVQHAVLERFCAHVWNYHIQESLRNDVSLDYDQNSLMGRLMAQSLRVDNGKALDRPRCDALKGFTMKVQGSLFHEQLIKDPLWMHQHHASAPIFLRFQREVEYQELEQKARIAKLKRRHLFNVKMRKRQQEAKIREDKAEQQRQRKGHLHEQARQGRLEALDELRAELEMHSSPSQLRPASSGQRTSHVHSQTSTSDGEVAHADPPLVHPFCLPGWTAPQ